MTVAVDSTGVVVPDRGDDDDTDPFEIPVDNDPSSTPRPFISPPLSDKNCPSAISSNYQAFMASDNIRTCRSNADCDGFNTMDGPTCCIFPHCICGQPNDRTGTECVADV